LGASRESARESGAQETSKEEAEVQRPESLPDLRLIVVFVIYAAIATNFRANTQAMLITIAIPGAVVLTIAVARGWLRPGRLVTEHAGAPHHSKPANVVGLAIWLALIAIAVGFQLAMFMSNPRSVYPTLSSLLAGVFDTRALRAGAFALWLWLAWYLLDR
jgi:hypothetical protein